MHCEELHLAVLLLYLPDEQSVQSLSESWSVAAAPDLPYLPVAQLMQSLVLELDAVVENFPRAQA